MDLRKVPTPSEIADRAFVMAKTNQNDSIKITEYDIDRLVWRSRIEMGILVSIVQIVISIIIKLI